MKNVIWSLIILSIIAGSCVSSETYRNEVFKADSLRHELGLEKNLRLQIQEYANNLYFQLTSSGKQSISIKAQPSPLPKATRPVSLPPPPATTESEPGVGANETEEVNAPDAVSDLGDLNTYPHLRIRNSGESKVLTFTNETFFESGKTTLSSGGLQDISRIAETLKDREDYLITVEGHTDNVEKSNETGIIDRWDLSVMRATEVVRKLIAQGVSPHRLVISGRGQFKPRVPNETEEGRNRNRRIEIILTPIRFRR